MHTIAFMQGKYAAFRALGLLPAGQEKVAVSHDWIRNRVAGGVLSRTLRGIPQENIAESLQGLTARAIDRRREILKALPEEAFGYSGMPPAQRSAFDKWDQVSHVTSYLGRPQDYDFDYYGAGYHPVNKEHLAAIHPDRLNAPYFR